MKFQWFHETLKYKDENVLKQYSFSLYRDVLYECNVDTDKGWTCIGLRNDSQSPIQFDYYGQLMATYLEEICSTYPENQFYFLEYDQHGYYRIDFAVLRQDNGKETEIWKEVSEVVKQFEDFYYLEDIEKVENMFSLENDVRLVNLLIMLYLDSRLNVDIPNFHEDDRFIHLLDGYGAVDVSDIQLNFLDTEDGSILNSYLAYEFLHQHDVLTYVEEKSSIGKDYALLNDPEFIKIIQKFRNGDV